MVVLTCSYDDGSGSEAGDEEAHEGASGARDDGRASEDGDSNMDAELANFMEELESSGLLKEGDNPGHPPSGEQDDQVTAAPAEEAPSSSAAVEEPQAENGHSDRIPDAEAAAGNSGTVQAEQRVLGSLEGCLGWHEVMDMGSGKVYFWNEDTDDVAWDPPEGSVPRSKQQNDATFAEAHAVPEPDAISGDALSSPPAAEPAVRSAEPAVGDPPDESTPAEEARPGTSGGANELPDEPAARSDQEEGEIDEQAAAVERPAEEVGTAGEELLASAWEAAERICGPMPLLVRLAVEVEVRLRDWRAFSDAQRRAADSGDLGGALSWAMYQRSVQESWRTLQAAMPMALQEAEAGLAAATAAMADTTAAAAGASQAPEAAEDGEIPDGTTAPAAAPRNSPDLREVPAPADPAEPADLPQPSQPPLPANEADSDVDMELDDTPALPQPTSQPQLPQPAATDPSTSAALAHINSRIAAASAAAGAQPAVPSMPVRLPAPAAQWPGYYVPYAHYMHPQPFYVPQPLGSQSSADAGVLQPPAGEQEGKRKREKATVGIGPLAKKKKALKGSKATSSLIDKWAAVRKDLVEAEEEDEVLDADALERKRLREAEEWRLKQLRAGVSSEDNSNFQPLAVDWREKLKTTKAAAEKKRKPVSAQQAPVTYTEKPDLEALSVGLPAGWKALWDKASKEVYYANPKTKESDQKAAERVGAADILMQDEPPWSSQIYSAPVPRARCINRQMSLSLRKQEGDEVALGRGIGEAASSQAAHASMLVLPDSPPSNSTGTATPVAPAG
ncbi:hypothetical protein COCSUDRAFT_83679 [Coccomyxa subellipsoidea C-169]|uniref:WW domain-containing protein n=1 Tax=Coccomyxa subellipsoidea (strain C-169) TaxID=574566 RepID=I0Z156_COCSC|nr:hypothetical protein COCSUDRAFT_83679 [Coccomyxa subellipsoidea C-169]EIE24375.1 hypothetical protein COCSUDRAFT_83679 [Coccomyxa subellipsoidea C-169]|eukprot:XP_005648919.1 hypothetical protein COCSUDRAFT_83679 [Coccomyxa subellipsoidea C-169]